MEKMELETPIFEMDWMEIAMGLFAILTGIIGYMAGRAAGRREASKTNGHA